MMSLIVEGQREEFLYMLVLIYIYISPSPPPLPTPRRPFEMPLNERFTEEDELLFALQIASGMEALINCGVRVYTVAAHSILVSYVPPRPFG